MDSGCPGSPVMVNEELRRKNVEMEGSGENIEHREGKRNGETFNVQRGSRQAPIPHAGRGVHACGTARETRALRRGRDEASGRLGGKAESSLRTPKGGSGTPRPRGAGFRTIAMGRSKNAV